ncbi:MAG: asparagine synthase (glutamine-hydrolyzing) [Desulfobacteraceae bacterium]|nr:asparagine synthase (glutamine-hydrolyzing) [Desulfobacteraceae bacterium]
MCGICGVFNHRSGGPVEAAVLHEMTGTMAHRGPDDRGYRLDGPVGLGHCRLSIIDLATGRQPIHNEDETIWIVYNGEIYNAPELRPQLERQGHRFHTLSDTEVIVHAYEQFGLGCLERLNGMFAFAIWDSRLRRLFLARDRAGIKPLYYAELPGSFVFGSEVKALLGHPSVERRLDLASLNQYLAYEYVPTPGSIFEGIRKLPPGHLMTVKDGCVAIERYWDMCFPADGERLSRSPAEYEEEFRETLKESVRLELLSDVPLGVLLSGGIDSSSVAAAMVHHSTGKVRSFSVVFDDPSFDESRYSRLMAHRLGTEHHELRLDSDMSLRLVRDLGDYMDEPISDSSFIPTFWLTRFTSGYVKVALSGDGGDELFGGYPTLQAHRLAKYYQKLLPACIGRGLASRVADRLPVSFDYLSLDFKIRRFLMGQSAPPPVRHHIWMGSFTGPERRLLLAGPALLDDGQVEEVALAHARASGTRDMLDQILYCDLKLFLEGTVLQKMDRASMANSLEVRVPLLNRKFLEFSARLPNEYKLHGFTTKYIMRHAMRSVLPREIVKRGKKGFNMPMAKWLTGPLRPLAEDLLSDARLKRIGLFDPAFVQGLLRDHLAKRRDNRKMLWTLLAFELWYEKWMR